MLQHIKYACRKTFALENDRNQGGKVGQRAFLDKECFYEVSCLIFSFGYEKIFDKHLGGLLMPLIYVKRASRKFIDKVSPV